MVIFEWNESKNTTNKKKHKVSFEEAQLAFKDTIVWEKSEKKFALSGSLIEIT